MNVVFVFAGFTLFYFLLIWKSGKTYPVLYLFLFTFFLQYIFSTYLIYNLYEELGDQMPIGQNRYFEYAIPALFSLFAGVLLFNRDINIEGIFEGVDGRRAARLGYLLLFISYSFDFTQFIGVGSLASVVSFTSYLKYSAAFCFLFTRSTLNYLLVSLIYLQLALIVLVGGVFMDFLIWSTFLFFFVCLKFKIAFWFRLGFIIIAFPILILIQNTKGEYREITWAGKEAGGFRLFAEVASKNRNEVEGVPFIESKGVVRTVGRLTQGWHLGLTLRRVPQKQPFVNGRELMGDVGGSILPRVLFPDKKLTHNSDKFKKYTGHKLPKSTAMTIGILGDFYINFGWWGSIVGLFIFGALISRFLFYFQMKFVRPDPINIVWVPYMLSYFVRADNDFYIMFNCLFKGFLIFLFVRFLEKNIWQERGMNGVHFSK